MFNNYLYRVERPPPLYFYACKDITLCTAEICKRLYAVVCVYSLRLRAAIEN